MEYNSENKCKENCYEASGADRDPCRGGAAEKCHPAQLYESMAYLMVFIVILFLYKNFRNKVGSGLFSGFTLFTIFTFRFFIEYIKEVQVDFENGMFINMGQILSIPLIIAGGYLIYRSIKWEEAK